MPAGLLTATGRPCCTMACSDSSSGHPTDGQVSIAALTLSHRPHGLPNSVLCMLTKHALLRLTAATAEGCLVVQAWRLSGHLFRACFA